VSFMNFLTLPLLSHASLPRYPLRLGSQAFCGNSLNTLFSSPLSLQKTKRPPQGFTPFFLFSQQLSNFFFLPLCLNTSAFPIVVSPFFRLRCFPGLCELAEPQPPFCSAEIFGHSPFSIFSLHRLKSPQD